MVLTKWCIGGIIKVEGDEFMYHQYEVKLNTIPTKNGIGKNKNSKVYDWKSSIGKTIEIIRDDNIVYEFEIEDYENKSSILKLLNKDDESFSRKTSNLINNKVSVLVGDISKGFKLNINDIIDSDNRNLVVTNKMIRNTKKY